MFEDNFDFREAVYLVDNRIKPQHLNRTQEIIFLKSLEGKTYSQIAAEYNYDMEYIKTSGSELWKLLSKAFGEPIRKNNCTSFIRRKILEYTSYYNNTSIKTARAGKITVSKPQVNSISLIASETSNFQGREAELEQLKSWSNDPNCRFVMITGMNGCGKTTLATAAEKLLRQNFDRAISLPINEKLAVEDLVKFCLSSLEPNLKISSDVNKLLVDLSFYLQKHRCLLVLDNLDSIFEFKKMIPHYRSSCEQYAPLLRCLINTRHRSLIVATSRIDLKQLDYYGSSDNLKTLPLSGLQSDVLWSIFKDQITRNISQSTWRSLCQFYQGNPQLIKIVVQNLEYLSITDSKIYRDYYPTLEEVDCLLEKELKLLDEVGQEIVYWLAFNCDNSTLEQLLYNIGHPPNKVLKVLDAIKNIFLYEKDSYLYVLQPVFKNYLQRYLVKTAMAHQHC